MGVRHTESLAWPTTSRGCPARPASTTPPGHPRSPRPRRGGAGGSSAHWPAPSTPVSEAQRDQGFRCPTVDHIALPGVRVFALVTSACGATQRPNSRTQPLVLVRRLTSRSWHQRTAGTSACSGARRLANVERSPCGGLAPPTPTSDQGDEWRRSRGHRTPRSLRRGIDCRLICRRPSGVHATAATTRTVFQEPTRPRRTTTDELDDLVRRGRIGPDHVRPGPGRARRDSRTRRARRRV